MYKVQGWSQFHRVSNFGFPASHMICGVSISGLFCSSFSHLGNDLEIMTYNVGVQMAPGQISSQLQQTPDRSACILPSRSRESGNHREPSAQNWISWCKLEIWRISNCTNSELDVFFHMFFHMFFHSVQRNGQRRKHHPELGSADRREALRGGDVWMGESQWRPRGWWPPNDPTGCICWIIGLLFIVYYGINIFNVYNIYIYSNL